MRLRQGQAPSDGAGEVPSASGIKFWGFVAVLVIRQVLYHGAQSPALRVVVKMQTVSPKPHALEPCSLMLALGLWGCRGVSLRRWCSVSPALCFLVTMQRAVMLPPPPCPSAMVSHGLSTMTLQSRSWAETRETRTRPNPCSFKGLVSSISSRL